MPRAIVPQRVSHLLTQVYANPSDGRAKGAAARVTMSTVFPVARVSSFVQLQLQRIASHTAFASVPSAPGQGTSSGGRRMEQSDGKKAKKPSTKARRRSEDL